MQPLFNFLFVALPAFQVTVWHYIKYNSHQKSFITRQVDSNRKLDEINHIVPSEAAKQKDIYYKGRDLSYDEAAVEVEKLSKRVDWAKYISPIHSIDIFNEVKK